MTEFIVSIVIMFAAIAALIVTIRKRKRIEAPVFLFLVAFEIIAFLASGWTFMLYGAVMEMGNL